VAKAELERLRTKVLNQDITATAMRLELERLREELALRERRMRASEDDFVKQLERLRAERDNCVSLAWHNEVVERLREEARNADALETGLAKLRQENERLREEAAICVTQGRSYHAALARLHRIEEAAKSAKDLLRRLSEWDMFWVDPKTGKTSVGDGRYWQDEIQKVLPALRAALPENDDAKS
jgi:predicted O-linked N-acetylglucosamine transferase (SPINDLY family)